MQGNRNGQGQEENNNNNFCGKIGKIARVLQNHPVYALACAGSVIGSAIGCGIASITGTATTITSVASAGCGGLSAGVAAKQACKPEADDAVVSNQPLPTLSGRVAYQENAVAVIHTQNLVNNNNTCASER